jgi:transaldolase
VFTSSSIGISAMESLADVTTLSIDSGDANVVFRYAASGLVTDATTNPFFVSQADANGDARYKAMVAEAVTCTKRMTCGEDGAPCRSRR